MRRYLGVLVPLLVLGAAFAAACGGDSKTVKIPGGGEVSTSNKLPSDFPSDFPVYGGAKVVGSVKGDQKGQLGFFVTWETGDQVDKVTDFYKKEFEKGPWKSESTLESNGTTILGAKKDGKTAALTIARGDNKTTIGAFLGDDNSSSSGSSSDGTPTKTSGSSSSSDKKTATASGSSSSSGEKSPTARPLPPEVKLPKDFPTDRVPLPSDARVTSSTSFGQGGAKSYIITYFTKSSPEDAAGYFSKEMPKHGWSDSFSSNTNGEFFVTFTSGDTSGATNDGLTVTASASEDTPGYTQVGVSVSLTAAP